MQNKKLVLITLISVIVGFIAMAIFYKNAQNSTQETIVSNNKDVFLRDYSIRHGENAKDISVVEFIDPECESCAIFHLAIKRLYKEYYKDIQIVTKYIPNHKNSIFAIKLLESSREQGLYNETLDVIFSTQEIWAKHNYEKPELLFELLGKIPNIDMEKLKIDATNPKIDDLIKQDRDDAIALGLTGTPTIFVNELMLSKLSQEALFDMVESILIK